MYLSKLKHIFILIKKSFWTTFTFHNSGRNYLGGVNSVQGVAEFPSLHTHSHFEWDIDGLYSCCLAAIGSIPHFEPQYVVANYCHLWMDLSFGDLYTCYSAGDCAENTKNININETTLATLKSI